MESILIRQLDKETKSRLRIRASRNGHSMDQEAREILKRALATEIPEGVHLVDWIRQQIEPLGGIDLPEIPRDPVPEPLIFDE